MVLEKEDTIMRLPINYRRRDATTVAVIVIACVCFLNLVRNLLDVQRVENSASREKQEIVDIDPTAANSSDVISITHPPTNSRFEVQRIENSASRERQEIVGIDPTAANSSDGISVTHPPTNSRFEVQRIENSASREKQEIVGIDATAANSSDGISITHPPTNSRFEVQRIENSASREKQEIVGIDPTAANSSDVISITHFPTHSRFEVILKKEARCWDPYLIARLSGPALLRAAWEEQTTDANGNHRLVANYISPLTATFFVEIIIVHCNRHAYEFANFSKVCLEPAPWHRLTLPGSNLTVVAKNHAWGSVPGYWIHKEYNSNATMVPVYTRVQQPEMGGRDCETAECMFWRNTSRYAPYEFVWSDPTFNVSILPKQNESTSVCFIGASHSRRSFMAAQRILHRHNINVTVELRWVTEVGKFLNARNESVAGCDRIVFAVGQHDPSFSGGRPTPFDKYQETFETLVRLLTKELPQVPILTRTIHYNPLGDSISMCKPKDWRSPIVIDKLNSIIESAVGELNDNKNNSDGREEPATRLSFVDTNFLVGPIWDAGSDWCHLDPFVTLPETLLLLSQVLRLGSDSQS